MGLRKRRRYETRRKNIGQRNQTDMETSKKCFKKGSEEK